MSEAHSSDAPGMRTQIRFGDLLKEYVRKNLKDYILLEQFVSPTHLLYLYMSTKDDKWNFFTLFQVARFQGRMTVEMGMSKRKMFPYYSTYLEPFLAVDGVRERLGYLMFKEDRWWEFRGLPELRNAMNEIFTMLFSRGMYVLVNSSEYKLDNELERAGKLYQDWLKIEEKNQKKALGKRFGLPQEAEIWQQFKTGLESGLFDRSMGGVIKNAYLNDEARQSCHLYMTCRLLQQDNLENLMKAKTLYYPYEQDQAVVIHRRAPQLDFFVKNEGLEARKEYFSFIKALEITEALYRESGEKIDGEKP